MRKVFSGLARKIGHEKMCYFCFPDDFLQTFLDNNSYCGSGENAILIGPLLAFFCECGLDCAKQKHAACVMKIIK